MIPERKLYRFTCISRADAVRALRELEHEKYNIIIRSSVFKLYHSWAYYPGLYLKIMFHEFYF